ncbi:MAG: hypothetical protein FJ071_06365 [Cyanobacteria bacterium M_DeepCast_200m_mx_001]|nr:hypothetical protein [Cyanobacteria bacterium M_DeepCast_200m_mx_001]
MAARCRLLGLSLAVVPLLWAPPLHAKPPSCSNATLKGTYLYSSNGVLDGKPYAESGREVYDGQGGIVLSFRGSDGAGGTERASYSVSADCIGKAVYPDGQSAVSFISPDGSRFSYTIIRAPGDRRTSLSGWEIRVAP